MAVSRIALRQRMKQRRVSLEEHERAEKQRVFTVNAVTWLERQASLRSNALAGYVAIKGEMDVFPVMKALHKNGCSLCLPVIEPGSRLLRFHRWHPGDPLVAGSGYAIPQPESSSERAVPQLLLVPLLAYDRQGNRLGYGGGYYDATLQLLRQQASGLKVLGCAYAFQQVDVLPVEAHDQPLDGVLTEQGVTLFK